jgi:branched-subunit amino acid ABC-type transport system permease component
VIPFRLLRGIGLYWSPLQDDLESWFEGRNHGWEVVGRRFNIVLVLPFALVTVVALVRRRSRLGTRLREIVDARRLVPSLALMTAWAVTIAASYGSARFRAPIEPALALFAGIGAILVARRLHRFGRMNHTLDARGGGTREFS